MCLLPYPLTSLVVYSLNIAADVLLHQDERASSELFHVSFGDLRPARPASSLPKFPAASSPPPPPPQPPTTPFARHRAALASVSKTPCDNVRIRLITACFVTPHTAKPLITAAAASLAPPLPRPPSPVCEMTGGTNTKTEKKRRRRRRSDGGDDKERRAFALFLLCAVHFKWKDCDVVSGGREATCPHWQPLAPLCSKSHENQQRSSFILLFFDLFIFCMDGRPAGCSLF